MAISLEEAQANLKKAQDDVLRAQRAIKDAQEAAEKEPYELFNLCQQVARTGQDPKVQRILELAERLSARVKKALDNRCRGQCDGRPCHCDATIEYHLLGKGR